MLTRNNNSMMTEKPNQDLTPNTSASEVGTVRSKTSLDVHRRSLAVRALPLTSEGSSLHSPVKSTAQSAGAHQQYRHKIEKDIIDMVHLAEGRRRPETSIDSYQLDIPLPSGGPSVDEGVPPAHRKKRSVFDHPALKEKAPTMRGTLAQVAKQISDRA